MKKYLHILEACTLFEGIEMRDFEPVLSCLGAKKISRDKNQIIFAEGDPARYVGIVLSGSAQIIREDYYGNRSIVASIAPSQLFGESFACAGIEHMPVSVIASEKSEFLLIDCRRITKTCSNACSFHNRMVLNLLHVVASKNLMFNRKLEILSKRTTREKLMAYLLDQAKQHSGSTFEIPFDRQELADYLGVERSALSAEIGKLRREGILESSRSTFSLHQ